MPKTTEIISVPNERIESRIFLIRGRRVMFDKDLAELYGVKTGALNQAVKRNNKRFPKDFMFQLTEKEAGIWRSQYLRSQSVMSSWGGRRYRPYVFTEQGVAMLSSVLNSERAIMVNIQIMRTFTRIRAMLASNAEQRKRIAELEKRFDAKFKVVFKVINQLLTEEEKPKAEIGFKVEK